MTEIRIVVPGPPPRKNARGTIANGRRITPKRTREWCRRFDAAWMESLRGKIPNRLAKRGRWSLKLDIFESSLRHLDVSVPLGDIDSSVSAVLDAMQRGKWAPLDDDARVVAMTVRKFHSLGNPRVEITLTEEP